VIPVGARDSQILKRVTRVSTDDYQEEDLLDCRFVPLIGKYGWAHEAP
jgi:protein-L-isoaspartate(D-aspartate) O-methyltransferase